MRPKIRQPTYIPRIDGKEVPIEKRNIQSDPECLGSKNFDLSRSESGELAGLCIPCVLWRKCKEKRAQL